MSASDDAWGPRRVELKRTLLRGNLRLGARPASGVPAVAAWLADQLEAFARRHRLELELVADDAEGWVRLQRGGCREDRALLVVTPYSAEGEQRRRWELAAPSNGANRPVDVDEIAAALVRWFGSDD